MIPLGDVGGSHATRTVSLSYANRVGIPCPVGGASRVVTLLEILVPHVVVQASILNMYIVKMERPETR